MVCSFVSSRRRHTRYIGDWSSDVCSSDLARGVGEIPPGCRSQGEAWFDRGPSSCDGPESRSAHRRSGRVRLHPYPGRSRELVAAPKPKQKPRHRTARDQAVFSNLLLKRLPIRLALFSHWHPKDCDRVHELCQWSCGSLDLAQMCLVLWVLDLEPVAPHRAAPFTAEPLPRLRSRWQRRRSWPAPRHRHSASSAPKH